MNGTLAVDLVGTGDAFGSGGRLNTCFQIRARNQTVLLDCGASSMIGMKRMGLDPSLVDVVVVSHFHGDHYGGVPFLIRARQIERPSQRILTVVGPIGISDRLATVSEALFPGCTRDWSNVVEVIELGPETQHRQGSFSVSLFPVLHTPGTNPHGVRAEFDGRVISYSGDTEWTDALYRLSEGSDVFLCECYSLEHKPNHMDYRSLSHRVEGLGCKRLLLTHMGPDMIDASQELGLPAAEEGGSLSLG